MASEFIARKTATYRVVCTSPDVCKVPKNTPVPFPIQEMLSSSTKTSTKTFANGCEIFTYESYTTKVTGDQPGVRKGIKSGTVGEAARPTEYSFSVYVEGVRIVRVNDACEMNEGNTMGKVVHAPPPKADKITDDGKIDSTKDEFIKGMCIQNGLDAEACAKVKHLDYWKERGEELYTSMKNKAESITSDQVVSAINDAAETVTTTVKDTISFYQHASKEQIVSGAEALGERVVEVGEEMLSDTWDWLKGTYDNLANSKSVAEGAGVLSAAVVGAVNPGKKIEKLSEGLEKLGKLDGPGKKKKHKESEPKEGGSVRARQENKPKNKPRQPDEKKWKEKGGKIVKHPDGSTTYITKDGKMVTYNKEGYPDFSPHSPEKPVKIDNMKGDHYEDYKAANAASGRSGSKAPKGYTWHHMEDGEHMQLVDKSVHADFPHTGGASKARINK